MTSSQYQQIVRDIKAVIEKECQSQYKYARLVAEECVHTSKLNSEEVEALSVKRMNLCDQMTALAENRRALVSELSGGVEMKLGDAVEEFCVPSDKKILFPLIQRLKLLAHQAQKGTRELSELTAFSLTLMNSLSTLISCGGKEVSRSYSGRGILKESYHPRGSRLSALLKEV